MTSRERPARSALVACKAARAAPKFIPGTVRVAADQRKHGMKYLIIRERVFGIGDDY